MFAKVVLISCLALTAVAKPDKRPRYQPPQQQSYQSPSQPSYQAPAQPSYQPPAQLSKQPPAQPSYQPPAQPSYQPPSQPSYQPPAQPSYQPPSQPSYQPPAQPSYKPTAQPSYQPPAPELSFEEPRPSYSNRQPSYQEPQNQEGMPFDYAYAVQDQYSGIDFGHNTNSDGKVTTGKYRVLLPDGRTQIVKYTVDANGYQAEVTYEGDIHSHKDSHNEQTSINYGGAHISYGQPIRVSEQTQASDGHKPISQQIQPSYGQPNLETSQLSQATDTSTLTPTRHKLQEATYIEHKSSKPYDTLFRSYL